MNNSEDFVPLIDTNFGQTIEIINNTRAGIEGKIGERAIGGQIQVPDVHFSSMFVLDGFFNCFSQ